jgi:hypothetical protein
MMLEEPAAAMSCAASAFRLTHARRSRELRAQARVRDTLRRFRGDVRGAARARSVRPSLR